MDEATTGRPGDSGPSAGSCQAGRASTLEVEVSRVADRLRSLSDTRLARELPPHASRADAARALAQRLADLAADLTGEPRRLVPRLPDLAVGDQVAVTGAELAEAGRAAEGGQAAAAAGAALAEAATHCRELRLTL